MSEFGCYSGHELMKLELKKREFLVDQLIRERDSVLLVGGEKAGKSLLIKQLMMSLTSREHPFLDKFEVMRECNVSYVQIEGELVDTQDRVRRMMKVVDFNPDRFQLIFAAPMALETAQGTQKLMEDIASQHNPDVIIIDPLYFAFNGDLSANDVVRKVLGHIREIKDYFGCSFILVHHTHRVKFSNQGKLIQEGDDAVFGSSALKWWPDSMMFFTYNKKREVREFRCTTQRSGDILDKIELVLEQPDPLYFRPLEEEDTIHGTAIRELLDSQSLSRFQICEKLGISKASFYREVKLLIKEGKVTKTEHQKPVLFHRASVSSVSVS